VHNFRFFARNARSVRDAFSKPNAGENARVDRSSITDDGAFTCRGDAWSEVTRLTGAAFRVRLGGPFRGAWLATLSNALAERHISIDHTHARLIGDETWIAEFHLLASGGSPDLLTLDYIALAVGTSAALVGAFTLETYRLIESRDYGGTLMLTLEAADSVGLLRSLLGAFAELGLHPLELHIETRGGHAYDSLWLAAAGGAPPPAEASEAVEQLLQRSRHAAS
jgi:hypothetical protein